MNTWLGIITLGFASWALGKVNHGPTYTNRWAVKIEGGENVAQRVARQLGYTYKGQLGNFEDYYELKMENHPDLSKRDSDHLTRSLLDVDEVTWAKQQKLSRNVFKGIIPRDQSVDEEQLIEYIKSQAKLLADKPNCENIFSCITIPFYFKDLLTQLNQEKILELGKFHTVPAPHKQLSNYRGTTKNIELFYKKIGAHMLYFNDPLWIKQWYVQDYRTTDVPVMDHNVVSLYKRGINGTGVTVAIVDTVVQLDHPDLSPNIDIEKSYDICLDRPMKEAMPYTFIDETHGTEVAGIVAMTADNLQCGVGIAYGAKIAAIRMDCEYLTEEDYSKIIIQNIEMFNISSNSWGSEDDPASVFVLSQLEIEAYKKGTTEGNRGNGIVYIHSAGNGGKDGDVCSTDCTINQPYVIAITNANYLGKRQDYSERCTAIFATTYSGNMSTTSTDSLCTRSFSGTSGSCAIASGIVALTLQANEHLSYRDVMHIIARTAEVAPLADNDSWQRNGQGFWVSDEFGFGLMNAENMVYLAKGNWNRVPKKHTCIVKIRLAYPETLSWNKKVAVKFETDACSHSELDKVVYLEHLEVASVVEYPKRGDIEVYVTSPAGTRSLLLGARPADIDKDGLEGWPIMSVHTWGEHPRGIWEIEYKITDKPQDKEAIGNVKEFTFTFHGMGERRRSEEKQREYAAFRLPNGITENGLQG